MYLYVYAVHADLYVRVSACTVRVNAYCSQLIEEPTKWFAEMKLLFIFITDVTKVRRSERIILQQNFRQTTVSHKTVLNSCLLPVITVFEGK